MSHAQIGLFWLGAALMVAIGSPNVTWIMLVMAMFSFCRALLSDD